MEMVLRYVVMSMALSLPGMVMIFPITFFALSIIPWFRRLSKLSVFLAFLGTWYITALILPLMDIERNSYMYCLQAAVSVVILVAFRLFRTQGK